MNGSTLMYCSTGGWPRVIAISPVSKRSRYATKNATMPSDRVGDDVERDEQAIVAPYHR